MPLDIIIFVIIVVIFLVAGFSQGGRPRRSGSTADAQKMFRDMEQRETIEKTAINIDALHQQIHRSNVRISELEQSMEQLQSVLDELMKNTPNAGNKSQHDSPWKNHKARDQPERYALIFLGLAPNGAYSLSDIKAAYREKMKAAHPDQGGSSKEVQKVSGAYTELKKVFERQGIQDASVKLGFGG